MHHMSDSMSHIFAMILMCGKRDGYRQGAGGTVLPHSQNESNTRWKEFIPLPKTGLGLFEIMVLPTIKKTTTSFKLEI